MGGGHVSRPDFGMAQPDPAHPLTEFYQLVQQALDKAGCFALPALYASLQAPARRIYPEEAREYLRLAPQAGEGFVRLQAAVQMQVLYSSLQVVADGAPAALLLMGSSIAKYRPLDMLTNWRAYVAVAFRLVIVPVACLAVARIWPGMTPMFITTLVLEMAMPVGSNGTLYCLQYGKDARPMMQCTFLSILCSILTIPLVATLCG